MKKVLLVVLAVIVFMTLACLCMPRSRAIINVISKTNQNKVLGKNKEITNDSYKKELAVKCFNGTFVGKKTSVKTFAWKGIPFAKPPVGQLRWKAPVKAEKSDKVFESYGFARKPVGIMAKAQNVSEDCLYLNIFTGNKDAQNKPVIVFIHGGSFIHGAASDSLYWFEEISAMYPDVIFVSIEYRTGILGFADFENVEGADDYAQNCNFGLLDQICALEWINENIAGFGGDNSNVTLWGQDAGAASAMLLSCMNHSKPLFNKVIAQSGTAQFCVEKKDAQKNTARLLEIFNAKNMDDLLKVSQEDLIAHVHEFTDAFAPVKDGITVAENPLSVFNDDEVKGIKFLLGRTDDELKIAYRSFKDKSKYPEFVDAVFDKAMTRIPQEKAKFYKEYVSLQNGNNGMNKEKLLTEICFGIPMMEAADILSHNEEVYFYNYAYNLFGLENSSAHSDDLYMILNQSTNKIALGIDNPEVDEFSKKFCDLLVSFAKEGKPSSLSVNFEQYNEAKANVLEITNEGFTMKEGFLKELRADLKGNSVENPWIMAMDYILPSEQTQKFFEEEKK